MDTNENDERMNEISLGVCGVQLCGGFLSRQQSAYLSLQSHLVTLQVLSASSLLQEFIPHLLHLSSQVQTDVSLLRSHTIIIRHCASHNRNHCSSQ